MRVEWWPVHRLGAVAAGPGGVSTAVAEAGLMSDGHFAGAEGVPVGYLAPFAADMPIFAILLSGHVSCLTLRQTLRHDDLGEPVRRR